MSYSLYYVTSSWLAFCSDHGSAFVYSSECFPQVSCSADKRNPEFTLIDMVDIIGGAKDLGFIYIIDFNGFKNLGLYKVTDTAHGHDRNRYRVLYPFDHLRVAHS